MAYRFNHVHLKAPDPEKTANWYVTAFEFRIVRDTVRDFGDRFIRCETSDGTTVTISGARTGEIMGDGNASAHWGLEHIALDVDDMDFEIERLEGLGTELMEGPLDMPGGMRIAWVKGPDDVRIEIIQAPE